MSVTLDNKIFREAKAFAEQSVDSHYAGRRPRSKVISNIIQGKLGEFAAYKLRPNFYVDEPQFEFTQSCDGGYDLIEKLSQRTVDIKCIKKGTKTITFRKTLKADLYRLIEIDNEGNFKELMTYSAQEIREKMKPSKFDSSYYIFI